MKEKQEEYASTLHNKEMRLVWQGSFINSRQGSDFKHVVGGAAVPQRAEKAGLIGSEDHQQRVEQTARIRLLAGRQRGNSEKKPRFYSHLLLLGGQPLLALHVQ